jgi:hypothetical protein
MDRSEASFLTLRIPILPRHILRALHYVRSMERYAADDEQAKVKRLLLGFLSAGRQGRGQARAWRPSEEGIVPDRVEEEASIRDADQR